MSIKIKANSNIDEKKNEKKMMLFICVFCFIVLLWYVYKRGQDTCNTSSISGSGGRGTRAGAAGKTIPIRPYPPTTDPCFNDCNKDVLSTVTGIYDTICETCLSKPHITQFCSNSYTFQTWEGCDFTTYGHNGDYGVC